MAVSKNKFINVEYFLLCPDITKTKKYYLYIHTKADNGDMFYVGIGTKANSYDHYYRAKDSKKRSEFWKRTVTKHGFKVFIYKEFDTKKEACTEEKKLIKMLGKVKEKTGLLVNITDGGEGGSVKGRKMDEKTRQAVIKANKERVWSFESLKKLSEITKLRNKERKEKGQYKSKKVNLLKEGKIFKEFNSVSDCASYLNVTS